MLPRIASMVDLNVFTTLSFRESPGAFFRSSNKNAALALYFSPSISTVVRFSHSSLEWPYLSFRCLSNSEYSLAINPAKMRVCSPILPVFCSAYIAE